MPKKSSKENKNMFFTTREELDLTREKACDLTGIAPERIEKIENERLEPYPSEVIQLAKGYKCPELCNYYCSQKCLIGKEYVPEVKRKELPSIVLGMLASLNSVQDAQKKFIDITADGEITEDEIQDFAWIQHELEKISVSVMSLQLWAERMVANGTINKEKYEQALKKYE